jgi:YgiT-type zinc finger domain-containing protein
MLPIDKCVVCNGNLLETKVTEIIKGGGNTATLQVNALVCQNCGERFYHADTIRKFETMCIRVPFSCRRHYMNGKQAIIILCSFILI